MPRKPVHAVARLMWVAPALLVLYGLYLLKAPFDYRRTLENGVEVQAEVLELHLDDRQDVSMDYVSLAATLPDGRRIVEERIPMPHTMARLLRNRDTVPVRVLPDSPKPIVIVSDGGDNALGRALWRLSVFSGVICLLMALMFGVGIGLWNRYLARHGDPAERIVTDAPPAPVR